MFCTNCGNKNDANEKFCSQCGAEMETTQNASRPQINMNLLTKRNIIIAGAIVAALILVVVISSRPSIVGNWEMVGIEGMTDDEFQSIAMWMSIEMEFQRNNTLIVRAGRHTDYATWRTRGSNLINEIDGEEETSQFRLRRGRLYITEYDETIILGRI